MLQSSLQKSTPQGRSAASEEAAQVSGQPVGSNAEALQILVAKAEQGNKRAAELLEEFRQAASVVGLDD